MTLIKQKACLIDKNHQQDMLLFQANKSYERSIGLLSF